MADNGEPAKKKAKKKRNLCKGSACASRLKGPKQATCALGDGNNEFCVTCVRDNNPLNLSIRGLCLVCHLKAPAVGLIVCSEGHQGKRLIRWCAAQTPPCPVFFARADAVALLL